MSPPATAFSPKEPRNGNQEILSSQRHLWASHRAWITATCLLFASIFYWLQWPYYSALLSLPLPHSSSLLDMLGGIDITGVAILAIKQYIQAQNLPSMPLNGNALWYKNEASNWVREYLPIGNGYLGAMVSGGVISDQLSLNIDSMWSGGPFQNSSYSGGNKSPDTAGVMAQALIQYRAEIFQNGTRPDVAVLTEDQVAYGSFGGAGYLVINRTRTATVSEYSRWLDMDRAVVVSKWKEGGVWISRESLCSYPSATCAHRTFTSSAALNQTYSFRNIAGLPERVLRCKGGDTVVLRGTVGTPGMVYEIMARVKTLPTGQVSCSNGVLTITNAQESIIYWTGATEYDMDKGTATSDYSFKGPDPHAVVSTRIRRVSSDSYSSFYSAHLIDVQTTLQRFTLDIGQKPDYMHTTDELVERYTQAQGNVLLEWLFFQYGRYLLFSSARGIVPSNLQGVWARNSSSAWSGDYHANINLQQVYWAAESTNLDITQTLWDYMQKTWMPRGAETAKTLYNTTRGWVTHNEMNIFGYTGMKALNQHNTAEWANFPAAGAWMMLHVWDHFDYGTADVVWLKNQGYPLLKSTAEFWLDNLFDDEYFKDGSLVVNPCNSPEQTPTSFGCAQYQQLIWELFNAVEKASPFVGETDQAFLSEVKTKRAKLDRGLHIGRYGQFQEWKLDIDSPVDTHRHLSHLTGLYPSYSIASFSPSQDGVFNKTLTRRSLLDASATTLKARGTGAGLDGDSGWGKVWRAAAWAQLGDRDTFYFELKFALERNYANNLFSLNNPFEPNAIFQFDANGAYPAALLNAIFQAPDTATLTEALTVRLLPALPAAWHTGKVTNARIRGGLALDVSWANGKLSRATIKADRIQEFSAAGVIRKIIIFYSGKPIKVFIPKKGEVVTISARDFNYSAHQH